MAVVRLEKRLANRMAKCVGRLNKVENGAFKEGVGVKDVILRCMKSGQFRGITRAKLQAARREEEAIFGKTPKFSRIKWHLLNKIDD